VESWEVRGKTTVFFIIPNKPFAILTPVSPAQVYKSASRILFQHPVSKMSTKHHFIHHQ